MTRSTGSGQARLVFSGAGKAQLVAAIAAAPAGRLSIPKLRDALVSQADVLDALKALVDDGTLDRATLRPLSSFQPGAPLVAPDTTPPAEDVPSPPAVDSPARPVSGAELVAKFDAAFAADPTISPSRFGVALNGNTSALSRMRSAKAVQPKTIAKFEALLADPPRRTRRRAGDPAPRKPSPPKPRKSGPRKGASAFTGADLVARFDALAAKDPTLSRSAFGRAFNGASSALNKLAKAKWVSLKTVAKFEALLADPPRKQAPGKTQKVKAEMASKPVAPEVSSGTTRGPVAPPPEGPTNGELVAARVRQDNTKRARAVMAGEAEGKTTGGFITPAVAATVRALKEQDEAKARAEDPVEQAKLILRRRNRVVYDAPVAGGPEGKFVCSGLPPFVTREQLIAEAEKVSGTRLTGEAA